MNTNNALAVALPDNAPKLTRAQVLKATAEAMDSKNRAEWQASRERRDKAWNKLSAKARKLALARVKDPERTECNVENTYKRESYVVTFMVRIPREELGPEVEALDACQIAKRITFEDYLAQLRQAVAARDDQHIRALIGDPKINKRFVELGQTLIGGAASSTTIEA